MRRRGFGYPWSKYRHSVQFRRKLKMANTEQVAILRDKGVTQWNNWRKGHQDLEPDLAEADLTGADLPGADLSKAYLRGANLHKANLRWADLRWARPYCVVSGIVVDLVSQVIRNPVAEETKDAPY